MLPYLNIFGFSLPTYGSMAVLAGLTGCLFIRERFKKFGFAKGDWADIASYILIGVLAGAKLLYLITIWREFIGDIGSLPFSAFLRLHILSGLVFYGGIIGAFFSVLLFARRRAVPLSRLAVTLVPAIPLIHAIARVGCFLAGCCGGDVYGLPVQLVEAGLNLVIFAVLMRICTRKLRRPVSLGLYLCLYSVMRFVLEFYRTDAGRGFVGSLSTSQFISCFLFPLGLSLIFFADPIFKTLDRFVLKKASAGTKDTDPESQA